MLTSTAGHAEAAARAPGTHEEFTGRVALAMILALAALLRAWHINQAGYGTQYYAAGVMSMLHSWHNFFFNSFDQAGFVSIDKPPLALWLQVASARIFGFSGWSIHVPQILEGVASVALLYHLVKRRFGHAAGLLAALFLAITPISVAVDRSNNTDSCLVLTLLAAAWALSLAAESGGRGKLVLSMALVGVAFNVKMLAAIVVVPPFVATYFFGAPLPTRSKVLPLLLAALVLAGVSLAWCVAFDLTPPQSRPYAGSTQSNSMLELVVGENGIRRFVRIRRGITSVAGAVRPPQPASGTAGAASTGTPPTNSPAMPAFRGRGADRVLIGPLRLASPLLADQMGWLYPLAAVGVAASLWRRRLRLPLEPSDSALLLWAGWTVTYGVVLSGAGGIFHAYYLAAMAPPVCALAAIGVIRLWGWYRGGGRRVLALPLALLAVLVWQTYIVHGYLVSQPSNPAATGATPLGGAPIALQHDLMAVSAAATLLAVVGLLLTRKLRRFRGCSGAALGAGLLAMIVTPAAWALGSMQAGANATLPSAEPLRARGGSNFARGRMRSGGVAADPQLVLYLNAHYRDERFLLATLSAQQAAPLILATGKPVMAMGGFSGADPILTPDRLNQLVQQHQLRFVLIGAAGGAGPGAFGAAVQTPLVDWVLAHGVAVAPPLWRSSRAPSAPGALRRYNRRSAQLAPELYDLRPDAAPTSVPDSDLPEESDLPDDLARATRADGASPRTAPVAIATTPLVWAR
jgi:4-amino-4-deoxy-L-arabinose transferase-like glycosyltransferase